MKSIMFIRLTINLKAQNSNSGIPTKYFIGFFSKKAKNGIFNLKF